MANGDADLQKRRPRRRARPRRASSASPTESEAAKKPSLSENADTARAASEARPKKDSKPGSKVGRRGLRRAKSRRGRGRGRSKASTVAASKLSRREKAERAAARKAKILLLGRVLLISTAANAALLALLMAINVGLRKKEPPALVASLPRIEDPAKEPRKNIERSRPQTQSSSSSASSMDPILAPALSPIAFTPKFDVSENGSLTGSLAGFDGGTGFGSMGNGTGGGNGNGMVGGMRIKSRRLGVILDVSGSMNDEIREVKQDLKRNFSRATVVEVTGCRLDYDGDSPEFDPAKSKIKFKPIAKSVTEAAEMLIADRRVDAIYWFSDLNDPQTKAGFERLSHLLGTQFGSERRPVLFYVRSVDFEPKETLASIARRSGGAVKVESYEDPK